MNPGLDYEKLKQESDEIDGLKGMRILLLIFDPLTDCGDLITMTWLFSAEIKSQ